MPYRKAIIEAIEQLHDYHNRSSVEHIRKHVKASIPPSEEWNNALFLTTLKSVIQDGDLEMSNKYCELSESFKKQRVDDIIASLRKEYPTMVINRPFNSGEPGSPKRRPSHSQQKLAKQRSVERSKMPWQATGSS